MYKNITFILLLLFTILIGLNLRYDFFMASINNLPTNTDEALSILMARDIREGNFPLLFWTQPYQFPLEAYLLAPFVNFLPADAFGARILLAIASTFAVFGFCLLGCLNSNFRSAWPIYLLTLLPSAYLLTRQVGILIPQYTSTITFAWLLPLLFILTRKSKSLIWPVLLGVTAGLSISVHLLTLSITAMVMLAYCLGTNHRTAFKNTLTILPAFLLGLLPYIAAMYIPNAYGRVTDTVSIKVALQRLWDPILTTIMPATLGINPVIFPDMGHIAGPFAAFSRPFVYFFIATLLIATWLSIKNLYLTLFCGLANKSNSCATSKQRVFWPVLNLNDIIVGATWITIILSAMAGFGIKYRYLLPLTWYFPFLIGILLHAYKNIIWRSSFSIIILSLAYINYKNSDNLIRVWKKKHFAYTIPRLPDIKPLIEYLDSKQIDKCYASWWLVYRIPYETKGRINCVQPYNERFSGWELTKSKLEVDQNNNVPYVILKSDLSAFSPKYFNEELKEHSITYDAKVLSQFVVYDNFRHAASDSLTLVSRENFSIFTTHNPERINNIFDENTNTIWENNPNVTDPATIQIEFDQPINLYLIKIYIPYKRYGTETRAIRILTQDNYNNWIPAYSNSQNFPRGVIKSRTHGLRHHIKLYDEPKLVSPKIKILNFGLKPTLTRRLRIESANAGNKKSWDIAELRIFTNS